MNINTNKYNQPPLNEFESPLPHTEDPHSQRVFSFIDTYGDKMGTRKNIVYKEPKLKTSGKKWYVEYYYRIPKELSSKKQWERFKVYEDINRIKTMDYAYQLLKAVREGLEQGFNPFEPTKIFIKNETDLLYKKQWSINQAILHFKTMWKERGIEQASLSKYNRVADRFLKWCIGRGIQHEGIESITTKHIEAYLSFVKKDHKLTNRGYNNEKGFLNTMFIFFIKDCNCPKNPCIGISKQKTSSKKHKYYDQKTFSRIKEAMDKGDPYLLFAAQVVYYLCVRSEKELKMLRVGNIIAERKQVLINAEDSKTDADRYVPMADEMYKIFKERKIFDYPGNYFVFSVQSKTKFVKDGVPGPVPFGSGFFSKRFAKIRKAAGLSSDYTIYGMKHTRIVHLKTDGVQDVDIMSLTGHKSYQAYSEYLKDLGLTSNPDAINKHTRKF